MTLDTFDYGTPGDLRHHAAFQFTAADAQAVVNYIHLTMPDDADVTTVASGGHVQVSYGGTLVRDLAPDVRYLGLPYPADATHPYGDPSKPAVLLAKTSSGVVGGSPTAYPWWTYSNRVLGLSNKFHRANPLSIPQGTPAAGTHRISWDAVDWTHGVDLTDVGRTCRLYEPGLWEVSLDVAVQTITGTGQPVRALAWIGDPANLNLQPDADWQDLGEGQVIPLLSARAKIYVTDRPVDFSAWVFFDGPTGVSRPLYVQQDSTKLEINWERGPRA